METSKGKVLEILGQYIREEVALNNFCEALVFAQSLILFYRPEIEFDENSAMQAVKTFFN